jgi:hypothetical protein
MRCGNPELVSVSICLDASELQPSSDGFPEGLLDQRF